MSKGCCGGASCGCRIVSGVDAKGNTQPKVTGTGTSTDPLVIQGAAIQGVDSGSIDFTITYDSTTNQWNVTAILASTSKLDDLGDVVATAPTANQVLGWDTTTQKWTPRAPTAASAGAVQHDTSLNGDGSAGSQLSIRHNADAYTETTATGLNLSTKAINGLIRRFATNTARNAASPAPALNTLSVLDNNPGQVDYWTGTAWATLVILTGEEGDALAELSGPYVDNSPTHAYNALINDTTDSDGRVTLLDIAVEPLASAAGVLSYTFNLTSTSPYLVTYDLSGGSLDAILFALDPVDGLAPAGSVSVSGHVRATLY